MDLRKMWPGRQRAGAAKNPAETPSSATSPEGASTAGSAGSLVRVIADFTAEMREALVARDRERLRAVVAKAAAAATASEASDVFFSHRESTDPGIARVFETAEKLLLNRVAGDSECVVAVRGPAGVVAVIRAADKRDWTPYSMEDIAALEAIAAQLALALDNLRLGHELERQQKSSIQALAAAIEVKDRYPSGHTKRVGVYAEAIAEKLPVIETEREKIRLAGVLHDIGKIGVPDRILLKPGALTGDEWEEMRLHTENGFDIVRKVAGLEEIADVLRDHHERWNGTGYPNGLVGEAIPFAARVVAVADTFDAIVTDRPYRAAMTPEEARDIILSLSGTHFDPTVVDAFLTAFTKLRDCAVTPSEE
jgi:putative nucleotidyltransferase with HDIG domain